MMSYFKRFFKYIQLFFGTGKFAYRCFVCRKELAALFNMDDFPELYADEFVLRLAIRAKCESALVLARVMTPDWLYDDIAITGILQAVDSDKCWQYIHFGISKTAVPLFYKTEVVFQGKPDTLGVAVY